MGGIEQAGGADHLFGEDAAGLVEFPGGGGGGDEDRLGPHRVPFLEFQGAVVHAGGQAEAVFGEGHLAPEVALVHAADLRDRDVALVGEDDGVVGDVFEERGRRLAGGAAGEVARIVLDAVADPGGLEHLEVEIGALLEPLGLEELALADELVEADAQLGLDALDSLLHRRARCDVVGVGVDPDLFERVGLLAGERVELDNAFELVTEEAEAPGALLVMGGPDLEAVAAHPEAAALETGIVAAVLLLDEAGDHPALLVGIAGDQVLGHGAVGLDRADAVDAGDRGHDDHVVAFEQGAGGRVTHPVDLLVDLALLLDEGIRARDVSFGLVVVVIAHEILDGVLGEEALELTVELGRERLVGCEDDRRALGGLDHLGGGEGLAGAGGAEQHLVLLAGCDTLDQFGDGCRLVSGGLEMRMQHEASAAFELGAAARVRHRIVQDGHVIGSVVVHAGRASGADPLH